VLWPKFVRCFQAEIGHDTQSTTFAEQLARDAINLGNVTLTHGAREAGASTTMQFEPWHFHYTLHSQANKHVLDPRQDEETIWSLGFERGVVSFI
jgi:hypothetical protein